ncbi:MAG: thioesterase family protein [Flavobacteriaceae bacterium]
MSHIYSFINIVTKKHLDDLNHVNNVQYLFWAQEIAKAHWEKIKENLSETPAVWMVRKHEVNYRLGAFLGDSVRIETYVKEIRGPLSIRVVNFFNDKTNQLLVSCETQWCWVELKNRKPLKVSEPIKALFLSPETPF